MEYLVAIDICSYRIPCKTILGDRSYKITKKRYEGKKQMLDVYKEALELRKSQPSKLESTISKGTASTIFDLDASAQGSESTSVRGPSLGLESSVEQLKKAIKKVKEEKKGVDDPQNAKLLQQLDDLASKESQRKLSDIYSEVVIDEINDELMKKVQEADGQTVVMLMRQERIQSFEKLWRDTNVDFYQTQENKKLSERLKSEKDATLSQKESTAS